MSSLRAFSRESCGLVANMEIPIESAQAISNASKQGYTDERLSRLGLAVLAWDSRTRQLASALAITGEVRLISRAGSFI
jgi:hypothetical protein